MRWCLPDDRKENAIGNKLSAPQYPLELVKVAFTSCCPVFRFGMQGEAGETKGPKSGVASCCPMVAGLLSRARPGEGVAGLLHSISGRTGAGNHRHPPRAGIENNGAPRRRAVPHRGEAGLPPSRSGRLESITEGGQGHYPAIRLRPGVHRSQVRSLIQSTCSPSLQGSALLCQFPDCQIW